MKVIPSIDDTMLHIQIYREDCINAEALERLICAAVSAENKKIVDIFYEENFKEFCTDIYIIKE